MSASVSESLTPDAAAPRRLALIAESDADLAKKLRAAAEANAKARVVDNLSHAGAHPPPHTR